jgi:prolyl-tRNA editing enzyme YbaK/EbsC (Cys-tRNA(Pro) deacylase)
VQAELDNYGLALNVVEMEESTRTSQEAANTVGCQVGQIAKSLVFKGEMTNNPILVIASGANRVNEKRIAGYVGEKIQKPNADYVLEKTGYAIGGIPPIGHIHKLSCFVDEDLMQYEWIWAAAGTPFAVFRLTPQQLTAITGGKMVQVK